MTNTTTQNHNLMILNIPLILVVTVILIILDWLWEHVYFIDGINEPPTDVGFTEFQTGAWETKRYEGSYGNNGFRLDFSDNSSTTTKGIDKSPNGNDYTTNNF